MPPTEKPHDVSVQSICNLLSRTKLLAADEVRSVFKLWRDHAKDAAGDVNRFRHWLVARQYLTEFQADRLFQGKTDRFFLNQYKLLDRIGQGRMAGVYLAQHQCGQTVAVKVLPPSKAKDPEAFTRFVREARFAQTLKHPHVVRTFQTGTADGLYYLVMEYLEGETLKEVLHRRGQLPPAEAARLMYQSLQGLQHIHEQGLIHRDLSPGNLMLVPGARSGQPDTTLQSMVKILDIGLGREVFDEDAPAPGSNLTAEGAILGTPEYSSPEQTRDARTADIRSDIYSLGCILYQCLAGQPPFVETQLVKMMVRHATEPAAPLKQFNPAIPDGLQQIVDRMMAKVPDQRYATPDEAAQALQVFLSRGASMQVPKADTRMNAYLQWLAVHGADGEVSAALAAPRPAESRPAPVVARAIPVGEPVLPAAPSPRPSKVNIAPAVLPAIPVNAPATSPPEPTADLSLASLLVPSRRDLLFLGTGAGGLLLAELVGWILIKLLFG